MIDRNGFIQAGKDFCTLEKHVPAPYFRRTFRISAPVRQAHLTITGLGFYEVHVNGTPITKGFLAPYRSNPDHLVYYDVYDISDRVTAGRNVLAVLLGNGMQNALGGYIWEFDKAPWRSAPKLFFSLDLLYENGETERIVSDAETRVAPSPILFDDLHFGEYYDASHEIDGWDRADFDDSGWKHAMPADPPRGMFRLCEAAPIVICGEEAPISAWPLDGGFLFDFGTNDAGVCRLTVRNPARGQKILLQHCEMLREGKPFFGNIRFNRNGVVDRYQEDEYTCAGRPVEVHTPRFTYHGFRYVYVTGLTPEQAAEGAVTRLLIHSAVTTRGSFRCDDEVANRLK